MDKIKLFFGTLFILSFLGCTKAEFSFVNVSSTATESSFSHIRDGETLVFYFNREIFLKSNISNLSSEIFEFTGAATFDDYELEIRGTELHVKVNSFNKPGAVNVKLKAGVLVDKLNQEILISATASAYVYSPYFNDQCSFQNQSFYYKKELYFMCRPLYENSEDVKELLWIYNEDLDIIQPTGHFKEIPTTSSITIEGSSNFLSNQTDLIIINVQGSSPQGSYKAFYDLSLQKLYKFDARIKLQTTYTVIYEENFSRYVRFGDSIYLSGEHPDSVGSQLLRINLSDKTVSLVAEVNTGGSSQISDVIVYDSKIIFSAVDGVNPERQMWSYNPVTKASEIFVQQTGLDGTQADQFVTVGGVLYFTARAGGSNASSLDSYDPNTGTTSSTPLDINPHGGFSWKPHKLFTFNEKIYYTSYVGTANNNDGNPVTHGFLEYDPVLNEQKDLITREELIGLGPHTINYFPNRIYDIKLDEVKKTITWIQYSPIDSRRLLLTYNTTTGALIKKTLPEEEILNEGELNHKIAESSKTHLFLEHEKYGWGIAQ